MRLGTYFKIQFEVLFVSFLLTLYGCGAIPIRYGELPQIDDDNMAGKIVVARISSFLGVLNVWQVAVDGKDLFGIGSGEYTEFLLSQGQHRISLRCSQPGVNLFSHDWGAIHHEETIKFIVAPSKTTFFVLRPSLACGKIRLSNETEAKKHIGRSKFINLEKTVK